MVSKISFPLTLQTFTKIIKHSNISKIALAALGLLVVGLTVTAFRKMEIRDINVQALLQEFIDDSGSVGASVAFIDHGKMQIFSYGKKTVQKEELISPDTIFEIGSLTKVFTTLALMDMVQEEKVQLDDPVEMYLPNIKIPEAEGKKITLRHLASHTSGLPNMPDNFHPKNPNNPYEDYTIESMYDYLSHCTLQKTPGESVEYSNIGMGLLGHILSLRAEKTYEKLIQDSVLDKLHMKNTSIILTTEMAQHFATGHHLNKPVEHWDVPGLAGAGAFRSNIQDMAQFLAANMGLIESPLTNLLKQCHNNQFGRESTSAMGLGWILSSNGAEIIYHDGSTGGFRSYLGFNPRTQRGVVILSNCSGDWPNELAACLLDPAYKKPFVDKALANDPSYLSRFAGSYDATLVHDPSTKLTLQISVSGKQLASILSDEDVTMLYPQEVGIFGVQGSNMKIRFSFNTKGDVSKVEAILTNGTIVLEAVPRLSLSYDNY